MRLLFVRHGESVANVRQVFSNRGWRHPLTPLGRKQASDLALRLAREPVGAIYTSPIRRAVETAEIVSEALGVGFSVADHLAEYDVGIYEGRPHAEGRADYDRVEAQWASGDIDAALEGGESARAIVARLRPFVETVCSTPGDHPELVVLIGHGGLFKAALPSLLDNVSPAQAAELSLGNTEWVDAQWTAARRWGVSWGGTLLG